MREIYNIRDVSEHRSLNKLAWVSVQALEGLKPGAGMYAQLCLFPAELLLLPNLPSACLSLAVRTELRKQ